MTYCGNCREFSETEHGTQGTGESHEGGDKRCAILRAVGSVQGFPGEEQHVRFAGMWQTGWMSETKCRGPVRRQLHNAAENELERKGGKDAGRMNGNG